MIKTFDLNFCFKGGRQYIHGTDMLHESCLRLIELMGGKLEQLDFVVHRMTDNNLTLALYPRDEVPTLGDNDVAGLKFHAIDRPWEARLTETKRKPDCRKPYEEKAIGERCSIDVSERKITLPQRTEHTDIEILVAMTKALHLKLFPDVVESWVFCRWTSTQWPVSRNLDGVSIKLIHALGTRLTRSEVRLADDIVGYIYFSARSAK